jgi:hypothetical protein
MPIHSDTTELRQPTTPERFNSVSWPSDTSIVRPELNSFTQVVCSLEAREFAPVSAGEPIVLR